MHMPMGDERNRMPAVPWGIALLAGAGFVYRLFQNSYGLPTVSHEEYVTLGRAWDMFRTGNFDPRWFSWPTLVTYLEFFILRVMRLSGPVRWIDFALAARCFQAGVGTAVILAVYRLTRTLYGHRPAAIAALVITVCPQMIVYSRLARPEMLVPLFFLIAVYASWGIARTGALRYYLIAGMASGLAAGAKYNGGFALIVPIVMQLLSRRHRSETPRPGVIWGVLIGVPLAAFLVTNPYAVLNWRIFLQDVFGLQTYVAFTPFDYLSGIFRTYTEALGVPVALTAAAGLGYAVRKRTMADIVLLVSWAASLLLFVFWNPSMRLMLTSVIILAIFSGRILDAGIVWIHGRLRSGTAATVAVAGIVLFWYSATENIDLIRELSRQSVSLAVVDWITAHAGDRDGIYWGYEAPVPRPGGKIPHGYWMNGDIELHLAYAYDYAAFKTDWYHYVILTEDHRRYLDDPNLNPAAYGFYTRLYADALDTERFDWDRSKPSGYSAPCSQFLRDGNQIRGAIYILEMRR
jgi:hypothetical protein